MKDVRKKSDVLSTFNTEPEYPVVIVLLERFIRNAAISKDSNKSNITNPAAKLNWNLFFIK